MMTNTRTLLFLWLGITLALTSCSSVVQSLEMTKSPDDIYQTFKDACDSGDLATAESLVAEASVSEHKDYGICILLPDGINIALGMNGVDLKDPQPKVEITGNTAYLTWWWTAGKRVQMTMYRNGNTWEIKETLIFDH